MRKDWCYDSYVGEMAASSGGVICDIDISFLHRGIKRNLGTHCFLHSTFIENVIRGGGGRERENEAKHENYI